ncbi:cytochrome c peroxidase [Methyloprofundus sp.]|uniref:cytochrome c peroxidase n=1 Tax=Methyloprofundus sp. TaxID=2020875 RepID=UPI003D1208FD
MTIIMKIFYVWFFLGLLPCSSLYADTPPALAPGYSPLAFKIPQAGSYDLPVISMATDGEVLTTASQVRHLYELMGDKITLLSFIYSTCSDVNGCPLATQVFHKINRRLQKEPGLADKLRLLTLSFNPEHDTPAAMSRYASGFTNAKVDWRFLTTQSERQLQPILDQYQQAVLKIYDKNGAFTGTFSHILRVYLIDTDKQIRNIYSVSFLHADTLINDVKTLLNEASIEKETASSVNFLPFQAGYNKQNYAQKNYQTQTISLLERQGQEADLLSYIKTVPLGLPAVPIPASNPVNAEKIALGRKLFFDRRLSLNNTFSCAMCHIPEQGFSSNEMTTAVGIEGRSVRRNSPTIYNVAYATLLFHDGRENTLEQQVWGPLLAHNEMGNPSIGYVVDKIKALDDYQEQFEQSFNTGPDMRTIGEALASYQRSLVSADSAFDRWYYAKQDSAVSEKIKRGFALFKGKGTCSLCHTVEKNFALFTDNQMHNTGIGYRESMQKTPEKQKIQVAPGVFIDVESKQITAVAEPKPGDLGRYEITQDPQDRWKYKTPSLRNIALTAPYMHNGSLSTLTDVVMFYNKGGVSNETLDPLIKPLHLNANEINDLVAFLQALTGGNVQQLVADAYAAPVGN